MEKSSSAPNKDIAIIGLSCRFPGGANSPEDYWKLLAEGTDAVTETPEDRWEKRLFFHSRRTEPGKSYTFSAGTLGDISGFDADFFGIAPREAEQMDPQQRLLLEMTWEALESGGQIPKYLEGKNCAVYVGISSTDYVDRRFGDPSSSNAYFMLGSTLSIAANRISYIYDFKGPSMAIDTACSSSMVALHEALKTLWTEQADMAVVGGINLLLTPYPFIGFSRASMLSPYGRCRAFDKTAEGYVRGEGGGILVLKPLAKAIEDGDPIQAVIAGAGTNADGRTNGIAMPSCKSQQALIERVLKSCRIDPAEIDYFEAHGTGTAIGDPIETRAIGQAIGRLRPMDSPLPIGSAKSNIGHLESASGMAGLIKAVMILKNRAIPPTLHVNTPNPEIDFQGLNIEPVTSLTPLATQNRPLYCGVNSFGFGGANATIILREAPVSLGESVPADTPEPAQTDKSKETPPPLILTARSEKSLRDMAGRLAETLSPESLYDTAHTLATRRQHHDHRAVVRGADFEELRSTLRSYHRGEEPPSPFRVITGASVSRDPKIGFIFSGNGAQWAGMGRQLLDEDAVFRAEVERIDPLIRELAGWSVIDMILSEDAEENLRRTEIAQPLIFSVQSGICAALKARGIRPAAVTGHSVGEIAAAYVSGALSLEESTKVIVSRSQAQGLTRGLGRMAAAELPEDTARELVAAFDGAIEIAAINGPGSVTLAGGEVSLLELKSHLEAAQIPFRLLDLDYAFHSKVLDPVKDGLLASLAPVTAETATVPYYSTVTGAACDGASLTEEYWWRNVRHPVRFREAVGAMIADGVDTLVEIGPHPILQSYLRHILKDNSAPGLPLSSLTRNRAGAERLDHLADEIFVHGGQRDLDLLFPRPGRYIPLPAYPWQRERYWFPQTPEAEGPNFRHEDAPLLGYRLASKMPVWENQLDADRFPLLADHKVEGSIVFPATGFLEILLECSSQLFDKEAHDVQGFEIRRPILLEPGQSVMMRLSYDPDDLAIKIETRKRMADVPWTLNAVGRLVEAAFPPVSKRMLPEIGDDFTPVASDAHYALAQGIGLQYGPAFQGVEEIWVRNDEAVARLSAPPADETLDDAILHPSTFDSALQVLFDIVAMQQSGRGKAAFLPAQLARLKVFNSRTPARHCHVRLEKSGNRSLVADFALFDETGQCIAEASGFRFLRADSLGRNRSAHKYFQWSQVPLSIMGDLANPAALPSVLPASGEAKQACAELDLDALAAKLTAASIAEALPEGLVSLTRLAAIEGMTEGQMTLAQRGLSELEARGLLVAQDGGTWKLGEEREVLADAAGTAWRDAFDRYPERAADLTSLAVAGAWFGGLLNGQPGELTLSAALKDHLLQSSPAFSAAYGSMATALGELARNRPPNRRLRILEIGAHVGLVNEVAKLARDVPIDYVMMSQNEEALSHWEAEANDLPTFDFQTRNLALPLDPEKADILQPFDIVLAPLVSLETPPSSTFWDNLQQLIRPEATLLMSDPAPGFRMDLTFGWQGSWWRSSAAPDAPAVSRLKEGKDWCETLNAHGFAPVAHETRGSASVVQAARLAVPADLADHAGRAAWTEGRARTWLLVPQRDTDSIAFGAALASALEKRGGVGIVTSPVPSDKGGEELILSPEDAPQWRETLAALKNSDESLAGIVLLTGRRASCRESGWAALTAARAMNEAGFQIPPSFRLVTWNAQPVSTEGAANPDHTALWGLGRVIRNEMPRLSCQLIDMPDGPPGGLPDDAIVAKFVDILISGKDDEDVILNPAGSFGLRLQKAGDPREALSPMPESRRLNFTPGKLDNLAWKPCAIPAAGPEEVVIETRATGLNFRDVMFALGVLPEEALENGFAGPTLGMEASGVVVEVGAGVSDFKPGDEVLCFAPACFASHIVTGTRSLAHKPKELGFEEAASIPTVFFTIYYALHHLARLEEGERILIHGAAGGVGLAAIQYARHAGAEIFVTAGSEEKRHLLHMLGIPRERILDSRSLRFADNILELTDGEGVDVVLNSLAGEAISANLRILKPFGRFLELGKRDFYENSRIGLKVFRNNLTYYGIDADQLLLEKPVLARRLFSEMIDLFAEGVFRPLPYRRFDPDQVSNAFRYMQQSKQIGKIIVTPPVRIAPADEAPSRRRSLEPDPGKSYLVTGGLGGFGLEVARWLADKGATKLVLVSRRGPATDEARAAVAELQDRGCTVIARACDVTSESALRELFLEIAEGGAPLGGLVHAAAVFEDIPIESLDRATFDRVLAPKVEGAKALHEATKGMDLELFVMFSSITTAFGNPAQANYVTANSYLEGLAAHRRALGLPALCVGWGAIGDAGYLARHEDIKDSLTARLGTDALSAREALDALEALLLSDQDGLYVGALDWRRLRGGLPGLSSRSFEQVIGRYAPGAQDEEGDQLLQAIMALPPQEAKELIADLLKTEIAQVLRQNPDKIDVNSSVFELGMDSLMALELRLGLEEKLNTEIPPMILSEGGSITDLSGKIFALLNGEEGSPADQSEAAIASLVARHAENIDKDELQDYAKSVTPSER